MFPGTRPGSGLLVMVALVALFSTLATAGQAAGARERAPQLDDAIRSSEVSPARPIGVPAGAISMPRYLFGVINDQGAHYADEWARGVRATTLELQWKRYEPQEGVYDQAYINHLKDILRQLNAQGWYVQLVPGYHYTPDWVFVNYPNMYFVNQYGEAYNPDPLSQGDFRVTNAPFNPQARALIQGYIARIFQDFDQSDPGLQFDSVRIGGGVQGEVRYPPGTWNGHSNAYWAFDSYAQDPTVSNIPPSIVGWRPGLDPNPASVGRGQLLVNPGFEETYPYYPILAWSPDEEVLATTTTLNPHAGSRALAITLTSAHRVHQYVRVTPNTSYEFGGWLRAAGGAGLARIIVTQYDASTSPVPGAPFAKLETPSATWTNVSGSLLTTPATRFLKFELDGDQSGTYYFDDVWLRRAGETDTRDRNIATPRAFFDWYVQALTDYMNWQIGEMRAHFNGQLDIVLAGKGLQRNHVTDALTNDLAGDGWSEHSSALYSAADYERHLDSLTPPAGLAVYLTGIEVPDASTVNDNSKHASDWSAARWVAYLAHQRGLQIWGENSGQDAPAQMQLAAARMHANNFFGLMWGFESELYAQPHPDGYASIADYQALIAYYENLREFYLPILLKVR